MSTTQNLENPDEPEYAVGDLVRVIVDGPYKDEIGEVYDVISTRDAFVYDVLFKRTMRDSRDSFISTEIELHKRQLYKPGDYVQVRDGFNKGYFAKVIKREPGFGLHNHMLDFKYLLQSLSLQKREYVECEGNLSKLFEDVPLNHVIPNIGDIINNPTEMHQDKIKVGINISEDYVNLVGRIAIEIIKGLKIDVTLDDISTLAAKMANIIAENAVDNKIKAEIK